MCRSNLVVGLSSLHLDPLYSILKEKKKSRKDGKKGKVVPPLIGLLLMACSAPLFAEKPKLSNEGVAGTPLSYVACASRSGGDLAA